MDNKYALEQGYKMNFDVARECLRCNNLPEARRRFQEALRNAIRLYEITYGAERNRHQANAQNIGAYIEQIDAKLIAATPTPSPEGEDSSERSEARPSRTRTRKEEKPSSSPEESEPPAEPITVEQAIGELQALIGLGKVKTAVNQYIALATNKKEREAAGYRVPDFSYHMIFTGNPGTGKTTVARIMAKILYALGICEKAEVVEVSAKDLVAMYVGHTADKTKEVIKRALGGVLFLDEAYLLLAEGTRKFGEEALGVILTEMENNRDSLVVIAAGYEDEMGTFLEANPGLPSRFKTFIPFEDYNGQELYRIFASLCEKNDFRLGPSVPEIMQAKLEAMYQNRQPKVFANGRDVRNIFERVYANQAMRLATTPHTSADLAVFTKEDLAGI